ncbi:hypothetical protein EV03_0572 [Prochlorococcus marinus str. PAC1]|uniref:Uncharacterized protein n=1 Tax=Prochlorococcus marinus str. PAC1 TaxID=59924 RepID=A0A0A2C4X9_PROMR|nr:hypothetical protein EV03_0572 [Prochlorococcus marinus str. PAC1]
MRLPSDESAHTSIQIAWQLDDILIQFSFAYPSDTLPQAS